jgi:hypothetical protein
VKAEVHVFLLWSNARSVEAAILDDIAERFAILDVVEVEWSPRRFAENLTRFYGQSLPPGSDKERHCGNGPFLLIVVEDRTPVYERRRATSGPAVVNAAMFDAKSRYRSRTGGGHRVHATVSPRETERDLYLLLGVHSATYLGSPAWAGEVRHVGTDVIGAAGWASAHELLTAVGVTLPYVVLRPAGSDPLELLVDDLWWLRSIARADHVEGARHTVDIAGEGVQLDVREVGDGSLERVLQEAILADRIRSDDGLFLPSPAHELHLAVQRTHPGGAVVDGQRLAALAEAAGFDPAEFADPAAARRASDDYVAALRRSVRARARRRPARLTGFVRAARTRWGRAGGSLG